MPQPNTTIYPRYGRGELNSPYFYTGEFPIYETGYFPLL